MTLAYTTCELLITSEQNPIALFNPTVLAILGLFLLILIALETVLGAIQSLASQMITDEQKARLEIHQMQQNKTSGFKRLGKRLWKSRSVEEDPTVLKEDHDYDGIRELDNPLPPWWLYLFYGTLIFGAVYLVRFHVLDGKTQYQELDQELELAQLQLEAYQSQQPQQAELVATQDSDVLAKGKEVFTLYCQVCHRPDGGGSIGPNLTDNFWINGGELQDIVQVVSNGGRPGKGMVAWKSSLSSDQIEQVTNYILSLQGTNPPNPKDPEGVEVIRQAPEDTQVESI